MKHKKLLIFPALLVSSLTYAEEPFDSIASCEYEVDAQSKVECMQAVMTSYALSIPAGLDTPEEREQFVSDFETRFFDSVRDVMNSSRAGYLGSEQHEQTACGQIGVGGIEPPVNPPGGEVIQEPCITVGMHLAYLQHTPQDVPLIAGVCYAISAAAAVTTSLTCDTALGMNQELTYPGSLALSTVLNLDKNAGLCADGVAVVMNPYSSTPIQHVPGGVCR